MKITVFTQNFGNYIGGGRLYCWHIIHCLASRGHKIKVSTTNIPLFDREYLDFPGKENITIYKDNFYNLRDKKKLKELSDCDLVICMPLYSADAGMAFAEMYGKKKLFVVLEPNSSIYSAIESGIEIPFDEKSQKLMDDFEKQIMKSDAILFSTKCALNESRSGWIPNYKGRMEYIWNSFLINKADQVNYIPHNNRENSVVFISRTVPYKGYGDIPYVFSEIESKPKIYYISGFRDRMNNKQNEFFDFCKDKAKLDIEILDKIGEKEKFEIIAKSKALFFPSRFEGFGLPIIESLYFETPVFCYDLNVIMEHSGDYVHNVEFNNHAAMKEKVLSVFNNDELLFEKVKDSKKYIKSFADIGIFSDKLDNLVSEIIGIKKVAQKVDKVKEMVQQIDIKKKSKNCVLLDIGHIDYVKDQDFFDFEAKIIGEDIDFDKYENVIVISGGIKLKRNAFKELFIQLGSHDFVYSNYSIKGKEVLVPDFQETVFTLKPNFITRMIGCKAEFLKGFIFDYYWELKLALKFKDKDWYNCRLCLFDTEKEKNYNSDYVDDLLTNHFNNKCLAIFKELPVRSNIRQLWTGHADCGDVCVISLFRTNKYILNFLKSINENVDIVLGYHCPNGNVDHELLDNVLSDGRVKYIEKFKDEYNFSQFNNFLYQKYCKNYGYIVICNDDLILEKDAIETLVSTFNFNEKIGVVGSQLYSPKKDFDFGNILDTNKVVQHVGIKLLRDRLCTHINSKERSGKLQNNYLRKLDAVTFAFVGIRNKCFKEVMLDEDLSNDFNDIDFCIRAGKNWDIYYNPQARAIHFETVTRKEFSLDVNFGCKNKFAIKHKELLDKQITYQQLRALQALGY